MGVSSPAPTLGVIDLDKPRGPTSHDMVGLVRRLSGIGRVGHAGTLDPLASGVLPILVGGATRLSEELSGSDKGYLATIRLGQMSATDDAEGPISEGRGPIPSMPVIGAALEANRGLRLQRPPDFSARKVAGVPAHRAARRGSPLRLAPREVMIHAIELLGSDAGGGYVDLRISLRCGPGTYVRALARDLGDQLGCGAYLLDLRRVEAAGLRIEEAVTPTELEALAAVARFGEALRPVGPLLTLPKVELTGAEALRFRNGNPMAVASGGPAGRVAAYSHRSLLGIGEIRGDELFPVKVLVETPS